MSQTLAVGGKINGGAMAFLDFADLSRGCMCSEYSVVLFYHFFSRKKDIIYSFVTIVSYDSCGE